MSLRFAIIGNPVTHSLSPVLHSAAFRALDIDATYERFTVTLEGLPQAWEEQLRPRFEGFNVTLPLKRAVVPLLDRVEDLAASVGAVNTVIRVEGRMVGTNTDILGIRESLKPFLHELRRQPAVVIGAGGTARSATAALAMDMEPSQLTYLVRDLTRASAVASLASSLLASPVGILQLESPESHRALANAAVIVQTTPVGMAPDITRTPVPTFRGFHRDQVAFDVIYRPVETEFMRQAASAGCRVVGGLDLFLLQGAAAFERWLGRPMPLGAVRPAVLAALSS